jgi:MFS family permease
MLRIGLGRDGRLLLASRAARMFGYGFLSVVLVLYLRSIGLGDLEIGVLLTATLLGDALISLWLTTRADRIGRRLVLVVGASLMAVAGLVFLATSEPLARVVIAIVGVISPSGTEVGPFLAVEQASLSQVVGGRERTHVFGWYSLSGSVATAFGALAAGLLVRGLELAGWSQVAAYQAVLVGYATIGLVLVVLSRRLSRAVEAAHVMREGPTRLGLHRSRDRVLGLAALFGLDSFAGGFVMQSIVAYWLATRWGLQAAALGTVFFATNLLAAGSALVAARLAARIGLVRTMVYTHLPSNILLILVPFMPTAWLAVVLLLLRSSISQMDVPARQSYTMAVVEPDERSAAAGVTGVARSIGAAISPSLATPLVAIPPLGALPFVFAGGLKIVYDLLLYRGFREVRPPEEVEGLP